jgi:hypothetical protein
VASNLFIHLWTSGAAPWMILLLAVIWTVRSIARWFLQMDPRLVNAWTRWMITVRVVRRSGGTITTQQANEILSLLPPERSSQEDQQ